MLLFLRKHVNHMEKSRGELISSSPRLFSTLRYRIRLLNLE